MPIANHVKKVPNPITNATTVSHFAATSGIQSKYIQWKELNPDYYQEWYQANKQKVQEYHKKYYRENREAKKEYYSDWRSENREHVNAYAKERRSKLPHEHRYRNLIKRVLEQKDTVEYLELGYNSVELLSHLEVFTLDWRKNHIDHKVPVSWFKQTTPISIVNSLENLQVLSASENIAKSNKFAHPISENYYNIILKYIKKNYISRLEIG